MAKLPNTKNEAAAFDELRDDDEQLPEVQAEQLPTAKPGVQFVNAAIRRGQLAEYDNMMRDKYGEGW